MKCSQNSYSRVSENLLFFDNNFKEINILFCFTVCSLSIFVIFFLRKKYIIKVKSSRKICHFMKRETEREERRERKK